jgi:hypothetical protein
VDDHNVLRHEGPDGAACGSVREEMIGLRG